MRKLTTFIALIFLFLSFINPSSVSADTGVIASWGIHSSLYLWETTDAQWSDIIDAGPSDGYRYEDSQDMNDTIWAGYGQQSWDGWYDYLERSVLYFSVDSWYSKYNNPDNYSINSFEIFISASNYVAEFMDITTTERIYIVPVTSANFSSTVMDRDFWITSDPYGYFDITASQDDYQFEITISISEADMLQYTIGDPDFPLIALGFMCEDDFDGSNTWDSGGALEQVVPIQALKLDENGYGWINPPSAYIDFRYTIFADSPFGEIQDPTNPGGSSSSDIPIFNIDITSYIDTLDENITNIDEGLRWLLMFILIVIGCIILRNQKPAAIAYALLVLGVFIAKSWIDTWLIVLLAMAAALLGWFFLRGQREQ